jgi:hypothetical protein
VNEVLCPHAVIEPLAHKAEEDGCTWAVLPTTTTQRAGGSAPQVGEEISFTGH